MVSASAGQRTSWTWLRCDPVERMRHLAECERYVLRSMPTVLLGYNTWSYLQKPFVCGLPSNLLDLRRFKYASIDSEWSPSDACGPMPGNASIRNRFSTVILGQHRTLKRRPRAQDFSTTSVSYRYLPKTGVECQCRRGSRAGSSAEQWIQYRSVW